MTEKEFKKAVAALQRTQQLQTMTSNDNRAQAVSVGTAGGGTTEITMRGTKGTYLWNTYQPVEVIELINQLAAGIGCHIHIVPREDFASFRSWEMSPAEIEHARGIQPLPGVGHPAFVKLNSQSHMTNGTPNGTPTPLKKQQKLEETKPQEKENVATEKIVNKRSTKRSRAASH